jgi:hypothetical protein
LITNEIKTQISPLGDLKPSRAPAWLDKGFMTAALNPDDIDELSPDAKGIAEFFAQDVRWDSEADLKAQEEAVNSLIKHTGWRAFLRYMVLEKDVKGLGKKRDLVPLAKAKKRGLIVPFFGDARQYQFEDFPWVLAPVSGTVILGDGANEGLFHQGLTNGGEKVAVGDDGSKIPGSENKENHDIIPDITIPAPEPVRGPREWPLPPSMRGGGGSLLAPSPSFKAVIEAAAEQSLQLEKEFNAWHEKTGGTWEEFTIYKQRSR